MKKRMTAISLFLVLSLSLTHLPVFNFSSVAVGRELDDDSIAALNYVLEEQEYTGLQGFEGEYELSDDDTPVSVYVLFDSLPAGVQVIESEAFRGLSLDEEDAEAVVEAEHEEFLDELADVDFQYEVDYELRLALNGAKVTLPANKVEELAQLDSVRAIYPEPNERQPEVVEEVSDDRGRDEETRDPRGNAEGRALTRANDLHKLGYTGKDVVVCIIDGGFDTRHPAIKDIFISYEDQKARMPNPELLTEEYNIGGTYFGRSFPTGSSATGVNAWRRYDPRTAYAHGTHVAGTVAGRDTGSDNGVLGLAPEATVFGYRVGDRIAAAEHLLIDRPDMATMSFGANAYNSPVNLETVAYNNVLLQDPFLVFTLALNNTGPWYYTSDTPDASPLLICVGNAIIDGFYADDEPNRLSLNNSSARGPVAISYQIRGDVTNHGTNVYSSTLLPYAWTNTVSTPLLTNDEAIAALPENMTLAQSEPIAAMTGCSMAAPHTAGCVALMIQYDRDHHNGERTWNRDEIKSRLMNNAQWFAHEYETIQGHGAGFVDVYAAVMADTVVTVTYDKVATSAISVNHPNNQANYNATKTAYMNQDFATTGTGSFSFGGADSVAEVGSSSAVAHIKNEGSAERTSPISYEFQNNPAGAASLSFDRTSVTVPAGQTADFTATFNIDPATATNGFYDGRVFVNIGEEEVAHLPFAYIVGATGPFTLPGGASGLNRPAIPAPIRDLVAYRPVISTNTTVRQNRASGMLGVDFTHWNQLTSTIRITRADTNASVIASLNQFSLGQGVMPITPGDHKQFYMLDRSAQTGLSALTENVPYVLNVLAGSTTQNYVSTQDWQSLAFEVDNTPPALSNVEPAFEDGSLTVPGNVFDAWTASAASRGITFPIVEAADPDGAYLSPAVDQSFNAVWVQLGDNPAIRAKVNADGEFEALFEDVAPAELTIWAIDNYAPIPAADKFRSAATNTSYDWAANALPYYVPGGFVTDERFEGFVWSGLNVTEKHLIPVVGLKISAATTLNKGKTMQIESAFTAADAASQNIIWTSGKLIWTSSNQNVATVDANGLVTARASGTVVITATTDDGKVMQKATIRVM